MDWEIFVQNKKGEREQTTPHARSACNHQPQITRQRAKSIHTSFLIVHDPPPCRRLHRRVFRKSAALTTSQCDDYCMTMLLPPCLTQVLLHFCDYHHRHRMMNRSWPQGDEEEGGRVWMHVTTAVTNFAKKLEEKLQRPRLCLYGIKKRQRKIAATFTLSFVKRGLGTIKRSRSVGNDASVSGQKLSISINLIVGGII
jgi:hypothetical protein